MFCCLYLPSGTAGNATALLAIARACSPRVESHDDRSVVFDVSGLGRVLGPAHVIAAEVHRLAAAEQLPAHVAVAGTMIAAVLLARARPGLNVVEAGEEAAAIADVPLEVLKFLDSSARGTWRVALEKPTERLAPNAESLSILHRWGLRTLGDLARLPEGGVRARLGEAGVALHLIARGQDAAPLVPMTAPPAFVERLELEWPIEDLEALAFVLGRLCDVLSTALERADRGATGIHTRLRLVTRTLHERSLHLPAPMRDARVLRTLILLDLESHPPGAAIDIVEIGLDVAPGRIVQGSLLTRSLPTPEHLATLVARLSALMGESRVGRPLLIDTHDERAMGMGEFTAGHRLQADFDVRWPAASGLRPSLRRFRLPIPANVTVAHGAPIHVRPCACGLAGGEVLTSAGPWRSSGHWWTVDGSRWDRDMWNVELRDGLFRLTRDRAAGRWEMEGVLD
jgi:protein ImuB